MIDYQSTLVPEDRVDQAAVMALDEHTIEEIKQELGYIATSRLTARRLAKKLLDPSVFGMDYDVDANLTPQQAFDQRRANCLSFTMLLVSLGEPLGLDVRFNLVDVPSIYDLQAGNNLINYRHINGVVRLPGRSIVLDLAIEDFDFGYPQEIISTQEAIGLLYNNLAVDALNDKNTAKAEHYMGLAISQNTNNSDLWTNMGVVQKRLGNINQAEEALLYAYHLDKHNAAAASNLERLYRQTGKLKQADAFKNRAEFARLRNPYYQYHLALDDFKREQYKAAKSKMRRAIRLHNKDPRFYALSSLISQRQERYDEAMKAMERAYKLSSSDVQRGKYVKKAELIVKQRNQQLKRQRADRNPWRDMQGSMRDQF